MSNDDLPKPPDQSPEEPPPHPKEGGRTLQGVGTPNRAGAATIPPARNTTDASAPAPVAPSLQPAALSPRHVIPATDKAPELAYYGPKGLTELPTRQQMDERDAFLAKLEAEQRARQLAQPPKPMHPAKHFVLMMFISGGSVAFILGLLWLLIRPLLH
jgi:hypothetical protein